MRKEHSQPEVGLNTASDEIDAAGADHELMTHAETLIAAQESFFAAEQLARSAANTYRGRDQPRHDLASAIESLAYGLKLLTATQTTDLADD